MPAFEVGAAALPHVVGFPVGDVHVFIAAN
jgi:hypothetical protein